MRLGRQFDHSPSAITVVKNEQTCDSTPPLGLHSLFWVELQLHDVLNPIGIIDTHNQS